MVIRGYIICFSGFGIGVEEEGRASILLFSPIIICQLVVDVDVSPFAVEMFFRRDTDDGIGI